MKVTKRKDPKYPKLVTLSNGRKIKVARQSKFATTWLRKHGCPFVSQFEVYQWLGMDTSKKYPLHLWKFARVHIGKHIHATLVMKGLLAELKHYTKGKAKVKYYSPTEITTDKVTKFLKAGCMIIITRGKPRPIHYYTLIMDKGVIYSLRFKGCTVKKRSAKFIVKTRSKNKKYGGMIVVTKKKKAKK